MYLMCGHSNLRRHVPLNNLVVAAVVVVVAEAVVVLAAGRQGHQSFARSQRWLKGHPLH